MIRIKASSNLEYLADTISLLNIKFKQAIIDAMQLSKSEFEEYMIMNYEDAIEDVIINYNYQDDNLNFSIDGIDENILYYKYNCSMDEIVDYASELAYKNIQDKLGEIDQ